MAASYELADPEVWRAWRDGLPAASLWADIRGRPGPVKQAMRATLAEVQRHECALCLTAGCKLLLDHDHETGLARGMLCRPCNSREGWGAWSVPVLRAYRADPPAAEAGWIWDACGSAGRIMLARLRAAGGRGGISCFTWG